MARKAGVSAEQTRAQLLKAAARVFALKGYDGASIADITGEADLSRGAVYAHFEGKAELFVAVVREHGEAEFRNLVVQGASAGGRSSPAVDVVDFVTLIGSAYGRRGSGGGLLIEAVVASQRHPEIAEMIRSWLVEGEHLMSSGLLRAQKDGTVIATFSADAAGRFLTMVALGARLAGALRLPAVDQEEWTRFIGLLVRGFRPATEV